MLATHPEALQPTSQITGAASFKSAFPPLDFSANTTISFGYLKQRHIAENQVA